MCNAHTLKKWAFRFISRLLDSPLTSRGAIGCYRFVVLCGGAVVKHSNFAFHSYCGIGTKYGAANEADEPKSMGKPKLVDWKRTVVPRITHFFALSMLRSVNGLGN